MEQQDKSAARRRSERVGVVVSDKMQKTVVVAVERLVRHAALQEDDRSERSTFMAHDEKGAQRGDRVRIVETRPLSKQQAVAGAGDPGTGRRWPTAAE